uniref:Translation initiation factor eIF2B subunit alpha n=1 Tax=Eucampia antarctica TaxID=49252 RepID=A0A7S2RC42_9STRA|mmetsp:Transcript_20137/g.19379  ORF Transcript_20137/g.19379 Transcript_20137/m.19379 type:complete len:365 (+) Transcript_20137:266-1360(+)
MTQSSQEESAHVISDLRRHLMGEGGEEGETATVALPVAAIKVLLGVIQRTKANTMMGLQDELKQASEVMLGFAHNEGNSVLLGGRSHIALASGCELFLRYVTRCFLELPDFTACIAQVLERGERFAGISLAARDRIAQVGRSFIQDGQTVLTHGWSRVVASLLLKASKRKQFEIIVLEGRPDASGAKAAKIFADAGIPTTVVLDSAVGYVMERVDLVIVGAEGVVENGGIVNKIGTYATAIVARELGKPFYVAAESYKFARLFPLNQSDLPESMDAHTRLDFVDTASWNATGGLVGKKSDKDNIDDKEQQNSSVPGLVKLSESAIKVKNPKCDYTPAKYITLLLTDLGVLTPSAVSDELIRLYQ